MGFHTLLIEQIKDDIHSFHDLTGIGTDYDNECLNLIEKFYSAHQGFDQIVHLYEKIRKERHEIHIEELLSSSFNENIYQKYQLPKWSYPKLYQQLPVVRDSKDMGNIYKTKKNFIHYHLLKKRIASRAIFSLFSHVKLKHAHSMTLFTWVIPGGMGDYYMQTFVAKLLSKNFYTLNLNLITLHHETVHFPVCSDAHSHLFLPYKNEEELKKLYANLDLQKAINESEIWVQLPTYYENTPKLISHFQKKPYFYLGDYGFLNDIKYDPSSRGTSFGLHFLENGILFPDEIPTKEVNDVYLNEKAFENKPLNAFTKNHNLYFAYLYSEKGYCVYLHSILVKEQEQNNDILVIVTDLIKLMHAIDKYFGPTFKHLIKNGIGTLVIKSHEFSWERKIKESGKKLTIIHKDQISNHDYLALSQWSCLPIGSRGTLSFSEMVGMNKLTYLDPPAHLNYFFKDLIEIVRLKFPEFHELYEYLDVTNKIRETKSQEYTSFAEKLGMLMKNPKLATQFEHLCLFIKEYYNGNKYLINRTHYQLFMLEHPHIREDVIRLEDLFSEGLIQLDDLIEKIQRLLKGY